MNKTIALINIFSFLFSVDTYVVKDQADLNGLEQGNRKP